MAFMFGNTYHNQTFTDCMSDTDKKFDTLIWCDYRKVLWFNCLFWEFFNILWSFFYDTFKGILLFYNNLCFTDGYKIKLTIKKQYIVHIHWHFDLLKPVFCYSSNLLTIHLNLIKYCLPFPSKMQMCCVARLIKFISLIKLNHLLNLLLNLVKYNKSLEQHVYPND